MDDNDDSVADTTGGPKSKMPSLAVGVGLAVLVVAGAGIGVTSLLGTTDLVPVLAITIAVLAGTSIAAWLIADTSE